MYGPKKPRKSLSDPRGGAGEVDGAAAQVNSIQLKETQEENDKTTESVVQDRQYQAPNPPQRDADERRPAAACARRSLSACPPPAAVSGDARLVPSPRKRQVGRARVRRWTRPWFE